MQKNHRASRQMERPVGIRKSTYLLTLAILGTMPGVSQAVSWTTENDVNISLDTQVKYSTMWRVEDRDDDNLNINTNDGNYNFDTGLVSNIFSITSDLEVSKDDYGLFLRANAWYDSQLKDKDPTGDGNIYSNSGSETKFSDDLKDSASGARLLDAYAYRDGYVADQPLSFRLGRQVINWGEALFFTSGINSANPYDIAGLRLPGAELRNHTLPVNMAYVQAGITDNLSMEAFYKFEWESHELIPNGAYMSTEDLFGDGSLGVIEDFRNSLPVPADISIPGLNGTDRILPIARQGQKIDASDDGQFGLALRYEFSGVEASLFFMNYHSRAPYAALETGDQAGCSSQAPGFLSAGSPITGQYAALCQAGITGSNSTLTALADGLYYLNNTYYDLAYPEDIRLYGLSLSGNIGETSIGMEVTYRPNMPFSTNREEFATLASNAILAGRGSVGTIDLGAAGIVASGTKTNLYQRDELYTWTVNATHNFGPNLGADDVNLISEVSGKIIPGSITDVPNFSNLSKNSYEYTLVLSGSYDNVLPGLDLSPSLTLNDKLHGDDQGAISYSARVAADYGSNISAELSYNAWNSQSDQRDRDNVAFSVAYSF
ncbi:MULTISPECIES: DUF1302 domain-containing protein [unclassified Endozoicomonas]|uniref:DUF1302 domain-containing protein n=2 Tax=Endozoicomonas TaxID=305899 RepID=UPI003BB5AE6D